MVDETQRVSLNEDFERKRKSYYQSNYLAHTYRNSLRRERREQINSWIKIVEARNVVLDVGCGPAILYTDAYDECDTYYAMDLVPSNLEEIKLNSEKAITVQSDLDSLDWKSKTPDLVVCAGCIEYSQDGSNNISRLCEVLNPGGSLIITFPNQLSPYRIWFEYGYRQFVRFIAPSDSRPAHARELFRIKFVKEILESENMELVATRSLGYCFIPPPFDNWFPKTAYRVRTWLEKNMSILGKYSTEFAVFARKKR